MLGRNRRASNAMMSTPLPRLGRMTDADDAAEGVRIARDAVIALADSDQAGVLAALSSGTPNQVGYAAATLVSALGEAVNILVKGDPRHFSQALREAAKGFDLDAISAYLELSIDEEGDE